MKITQHDRQLNCNHLLTIDYTMDYACIKQF